jgi:osmotically-inducible protein OsmY
MPNLNWIALTLLALTPMLHGCPAVVVGGAAATAMVADDRRTTGIYFEDENIELKANKAIGEKYGSNDNVRVGVTSFNRYLLLTGQVPSEDIKHDVGVIALGIENVRNVQNEVTVGPVITLSQRTTDSYTTSKVKTKLVTDGGGKVEANHVKVVTDNNTVFLMGLLTAKEADAATEIARTTGGVTKVVRVFELMD